jgi:hypothetical protein
VSIYGTSKGKALVIVERLEDYGQEMRFSTWLFVQSCSTTGPGTREDSMDDLREQFSMWDYQIFPPPSQVFRMAVGDRMRLAVVYEVEYSRDYWGEYDSALLIHKARVLRHQRFNPKRQPYWPKAQREV